MFGIGFFELVLLFVVVLLVFGPESLPKFVQHLAKLYVMLRTLVQNIQNKVENELELTQTRQEIEKQILQLKQRESEFHTTLQKMESQISQLKSENLTSNIHPENLITEKSHNTAMYHFVFHQNKKSGHYLYLSSTGNYVKKNQIRTIINHIS